MISAILHRIGGRRRCRTALALGSLLGLGGHAALAQSASPPDAQAAKLTFWFWGESDVPGIDKWLAGAVQKYEALNPKVSLTVVPQSSDTLIGAFRLAAQSKSGPDMDTQWATLPTLTPYWTGAAVPISDYVPASETAQWLNTNENTTGGKIIAMPLYLIGVPLVWNKDLFKQAGLDPDKAPKTWDEFLADCAALKAHGITPFGMGNSDGFFGAWMFAIYAKQQFDSIDQIKSAIAGNGPYTMADFDKVLRNLYTMMQDFVAKGYVNSDISSLSLTQGWTLFPQKKVAMTFATDGNVLSWEHTLGANAIGVAAPPIWGQGKLADTYDVTQSSDEFITSWSKNKPAAAAFLAWLHQPENLKTLYSQTNAFPADKRFPVSEISDPLAKQLYALDTAPVSIWLENYLPPQIDNNADIPAGQLIASKAGTPDQAVAIWDRVIKQWRLQQMQEFRQFKTWAGTHG